MARLDSEDVKRSRENNNRPEDPVVTAWYRDGGTETINLETTAMLLSHRAWLQQLVALQAYVNPRSVKRGKYTAPINLGLVDGELLAERDRIELASQKKDIAMDALTTQLAHHIEQAYERLTARSDQSGNVIKLSNSRGIYFEKFLNFILLSGT